MTAKFKHNGQCERCKKIINKSSALKHIDSCYFINDKMNNFFIIRVNDDSVFFWIYLLVPIENTLADLDQYVRNLWLECCGHLSKFDIDRKSYCNSPDPDFNDKSMDNAYIKNVLKVGSKALYEYDFGSTTYLSFEVVREYQAKAPNEIVPLMRNEMPSVRCQACENAATLICSFCQTPTCKKCIKKDACKDKDSFLPFLNSPRTGQCGYIG